MNPASPRCRRGSRPTTHAVGRLTRQVQGDRRRRRPRIGIPIESVVPRRQQDLAGALPDAAGLPAVNSATLGSLDGLPVGRTRSTVYWDFAARIATVLRRPRSSCLPAGRTLVNGSRSRLFASKATQLVRRKALAQPKLAVGTLQPPLPLIERRRRGSAMGDDIRAEPGDILRQGPCRWACRGCAGDPRGIRRAHRISLDGMDGRVTDGDGHDGGAVAGGRSGVVAASVRTRRWADSPAAATTSEPRPTTPSR